MKPVDFEQSNVTYAKDQSEYLPLPAFRADDGMVISCWELTWRERLKIIFTGRLWISMLTFNGPLQPQLPMVNSPFEPREKPNPQSWISLRGLPFRGEWRRKK